MNHSLDLSVHGWRGVGPDREPDLFLIRWRLGFVTVGVCRVCLLDSYRKLRRTIVESVVRSEEKR